MKKLLTLLVAAILAVTCLGGLTACGSKEKPYEGIKKIENVSEMKVGLICLHDVQSTYDKNFLDAFKVACDEMGVTEENRFIKTNVPEGQECYDAAADLAEQGCDLIFADSFGHEPYILKAAKEFPEVQFCHATGTKAHTEERGNFHDAFASIYEGRYLAGYAAGLKLNTMTEKAVNNVFVVGYVGAWPYAEVKSGYTAWFLGLQEALTDGYSAKMYVQFTDSWYDETGEKSAAENLINNKKCVLISQHADSWGAPNACETAGVPNVSYNGSTEEKCPNTYIVSSKINWAPYYEHCIQCLLDGEEIAPDWTGALIDADDFIEGSVCLAELGSAAANGTKAALQTVAQELIDGTRKVFDCSKFTVDGKKLTSYLADVDDFGDYKPETQVIKTDDSTGITYFAESEFRSAPYFDVDIDGIEDITVRNK